jgi:hypothetical protein
MILLIVESQFQRTKEVADDVEKKLLKIVKKVESNEILWMKYFNNDGYRNCYLHNECVKCDNPMSGKNTLYA